LLIWTKPIKVRKAMRRIIAYNGRELIAFSQSAFQLDHKFENVATLQLKFYPQTIVIVQVTMKFNETHLII